MKMLKMKISILLLLTPITWCYPTIENFLCTTNLNCPFNYHCIDHHCKQAKIWCFLGCMENEICKDGFCTWNGDTNCPRGCNYYETCFMGGCIMNGDNCGGRCAPDERCAWGTCLKNGYNCPQGCAPNETCMLGKCIKND